jgi:predicted ATP-grasp superfamily ATP-dependent carboligase
MMVNQIFQLEIYANEEKKLGFFISELVLDPFAYRPVADIILRWSKDNKCKTNNKYSR